MSSMQIFDGVAAAAQQEPLLANQVAKLTTPVVVHAVLFEEDAGSRLYTRLKSEAAARVGIEYRVHACSLHDDLDQLRRNVRVISESASTTGCIIQKPTRDTWSRVTGQDRSSFSGWWRELTTAIALPKDVDGLHPETMQSIAAGTWREQGRVLPATCRAVLSILTEAVVSVPVSQQSERTMVSVYSQLSMNGQKVLIIGKSDLLGNPLYYELKNNGVAVELLTRRQFRVRLAEGRALKDGQIIVSATGVAGLITDDLLAAQSILIDVGEPQGDIDAASVSESAAFLTPVPGGVGPMTIVSLLQNAIDLVRHNA